MERERSSGARLVSLLSRTPFPSLQIYVTGSFLLASGAVLFVGDQFRQNPEIHDTLHDEMLRHPTLRVIYSNETLGVLATSKAFQFCYYILTNSTLNWLTINTYFATLAFLGQALMHYAFKDLTRQEGREVREGFCSYVLFAIVFLSVVISTNPPHLVQPWLLWFAMMSFMNCIHIVAHERFKLVSPAISSSAPNNSHRVMVLCLGLLSFSLGLAYFIFRIRRFLSNSHLFFLCVDCSLCIIRPLYGLIRCLSSSMPITSDRIRYFQYWLDLVTSLSTDAIQLLNNAYLMVFSPLGVNLTCIFFFYHCRLSYTVIRDTLSRHRRHKDIFKHIEKSYNTTVAPPGERCVVCWEDLDECKRLPCRHQFHDWCLMWWLTQDPSCPTCRRALATPISTQRPAQQGAFSTGNATFRFQGAGFPLFRVPPFSIEFTTGAGPLFRREPAAVADDQQLNSMAQQVHEMFPQLQFEAIVDDLRITGSIQQTTDNVLEGRIGFLGLADIEESDTDDDDWRHSDESSDESRNRSIIEAVPGSSRQTASTEEEDGADGNRHWKERKQEMIRLYRMRYIASERGRDLRERGYE
ncbi:hypothetical protein WR25_23956 [Diploscapter pachys]|uniref:RING-type domain-containing protein n=1 Tax=Diploscapter pachys TaxID=2018661 RepID=A0A2A2LA32_9BILA|nr:hypothetical protein WR25_23956 [Diploscapter pachys]